MVAISWGFRVELKHGTAHQPAGRGVDGVAQGRRSGRDLGLADAAGRLAALDDMDVDLRSLVDPQHPVIVEIGLQHPALVEGDLP